MAAAVHPVVREQAFLESYFQCLSNFAYDKAREISVSISLANRAVCNDIDMLNILYKCLTLKALN